MRSPRCVISPLLLVACTTHKSSISTLEDGDGLSYNVDGDVLDDSHQDGTDPEKTRRLAEKVTRLSLET